MLGYEKEHLFYVPTIGGGNLIAGDVPGAADTGVLRSFLCQTVLFSTVFCSSRSTGFGEICFADCSR